MKKILPLSLMFIFAFMLCSFQTQNSEIIVNKKIIEVLGKEKVDQLQKTDPNKLHYLNYFVEHAYYLVEYPKGKTSTNVHELNFKAEYAQETIQLDHLNILKFDVEQQDNAPTYYKISSLNKLLVMIPKTEFNTKFKEYMKNIN